MKGYISKIQRYSTKDGPGLRTTVFFVGCNLDCAWCANPELIEPGRKYLYYPERCSGCGRCAGVAANGSIVPTEKGCVIDREACTNIGECAAACYYDAYESVGDEISVDKLYEKLMRDSDFYDQSGGGVTFSGGEAALQAEFVLELAALLRAEGIHVALDTAGAVATEKMLALAEAVDMVLYDIKAIDSGLHKACTGVGNEVILENARQIAQAGKPMIIRLVVVPGYNDDKADFAKRLEFVKSLGTAVLRVDILKFHKLGEGKNLRMGRENRLAGTSEPSDEYIAEYVRIAEDMGIQAAIDG